MANAHTATEKIISTILLIIGILLTFQAIAGYIYEYYIYCNAPTSYRISTTTFVSNLLNGNLLIISSLLFFKSKSLGALLYQYTGIMLILYAINLNLLDIILYNDYNWLTIAISIFILLPFGIFLYFHFKIKNLLYTNKFIRPSFFVLGIITYSYINLFFYDWNMYMHLNT
jgi:hypothetical protein